MFISWFYLPSLFLNIPDNVSIKSKACPSPPCPLSRLTSSFPFLFCFHTHLSDRAGGPHLNWVSHHLQVNFINLETDLSVQRLIVFLWHAFTEYIWVTKLISSLAIFESGTSWGGGISRGRLCSAWGFPWVISQPSPTQKPEVPRPEVSGPRWLPRTSRLRWVEALGKGCKAYLAIHPTLTLMSRAGVAGKDDAPKSPSLRPVQPGLERFISKPSLFWRPRASMAFRKPIEIPPEPCTKASLTGNKNEVRGDPGPELKKGRHAESSEKWWVGCRAGLLGHGSPSLGLFIKR